MADQLSLRGGTTAEHAVFTGANKEVTVDTTKKTLVVNDGATVGGHPLMRENASNSALALGSAATPSLKFTGDTNTGIYSPGADQVAISTAGSGRLFVDATGRVGIGASTVDSLLHLVKSDSTVYSATAADGQVGVGPTIYLENPANLNTTVGGQIVFGMRSTEEQARIGATGGTAPVLTFGTGDAERMRITSTGVGIGTQSPNFPLSIQTDSSAQSISLFGRAADDISEIKFFENDRITTLGELQYRQDHLNFRHRVGYMSFSTGGVSEKMRLDSSGRLLVGTSSTNGSFNSAIQIAGSGAAGTQLISRFDNNAGAPNLYFAKSRGASVGTNTLVQSGDEVGNIGFYAADGTNYVPAAQIRADIDGTPGTNDMPGRLVFSVTADGASSPSEAVRISNSRNTSFTGAIFPSSDNAYQCGASGQRWSLIYAANGTIQTSDARDKTDIASAALGIDFIKKLNPVSYKFVVGNNKESGFDEEGNRIYEAVPGKRTHWGFIAQEVKEAADEFGVDFGGWILTDTEDLDSQQGLRYDQFIAPLTKALQEALAEIDILKAKVASLEAQ